MSNDTTTTTATMDHLYAGPQPKDYQTDAILIAESQTLARGAAIGKVLYGAVSAVADGGNTGDGTCTVLSTVLGAIKPVVGDYVLTCTAAVTNGGVFSLVDPSGGLVAPTLTMTAGAGAATAFEVAGLAFTLTDNTTDFAVADFFTVTVAAGSGQGLIVDKTAVDGSAEIYGVLTEAVTTAVSTTQAAPLDLTGRFNIAAVTFAGGTAYTDVEVDARTKNIYFSAATY